MNDGYDPLVTHKLKGQPTNQPTLVAGPRADLHMGFPSNMESSASSARHFDCAPETTQIRSSIRSPMIKISTACVWFVFQLSTVAFVAVSSQTD